MKRNPETIRKIMSNLSSYTGEPFDDPEISYHLNLLSNAGFIQGERLIGDGEYIWTFLQLTWEGHEFLASISNQSVWEEVQRTIEANDFPLESIPLSVIKKLGDNIILNKLLN